MMMIMYIFQITDESGLTAADMITALKRAGFD